MQWLGRGSRRALRPVGDRRRLFRSPILPRCDIVAERAIVRRSGRVWRRGLSPGLFGVPAATPIPTD